MNHITFALPFSFRGVAAVTMLALLAWTLGLPAWIQTARAAGLDDVSDVLTSSLPSTASEHSITFTTTTALTALQLIRIYFDPTAQSFDLGALTNNDAASSTTHAVRSAVGACGSGTDFYVNAIDTVNDYIEYGVCTGDTLAGGTTVNFEIGKGALNDIVNPAAPPQSYVINIKTMTAGAVTIDEADTRVAVIESVTVTAAVDTIFNFSVNAVNAGVTVNGDSVPTTGTTTATTVPFGTIAPGGANARLMAQELRVATNAFNGFSVTVQADDTLRAGNGATIDPFINNSAVASSTSWTSPAGTFGSPDTYGHWGLTSDDDVVSSTTPGLWGASGETFYVGNFVNNPVEVFYHTTPVTNAAGIGQGTTTVAYKVEITNLQEAAKDYTANLMYIATPVF